MDDTKVIRWVTATETRRKGKRGKRIMGVQELKWFPVDGDGKVSGSGFTLHKWRPRVTWTGSDGTRNYKPQPECDSLLEAQTIRDQQKADIKATIKAEGKERGRKKLDAQRVTLGELVDDFKGKYLIEPKYSYKANGDRIKRNRGTVSYKDGIRVMDLLLEHFKPSCLIRDITEDDLHGFVESETYARKRGTGERSIANVNRDLSFVRRAFLHAATKGWIDKRLSFKELINLKDEDRRAVSLTPKQQWDLLDHVTGILKAIVIFLFDTGIRYGELKRMTRKHINLSVGRYGHLYLDGRVTKTGKSRDLPILTARLRQVIDERLSAIADNPNAKLFDLDEEKIKYQLRVEWEKAGKAIGIAGLRKHDLRHVFVGNCIARKLQLATIMSYTGHTNYEMFASYYHPPQVEHDEATAQFEAGLIEEQAQAVIDQTESAVA